MRSELYFLAGLVAGGFIAYAATKKYYEQVVDDEVKNVKAYYEKKETPPDVQEAKEEIERLYEDAVEAFQDYATVAPSEPVYEPQVIDPGILGVDNSLEMVYLTWYEGDECLVRDEFDSNVDDTAEIVDIHSFIGDDALNRFGEYEEDTVYVRNDRMGAVYIVTREETAYSPE